MLVPSLLHIQQTRQTKAFRAIIYTANSNSYKRQKLQLRSGLTWIRTIVLASLNSTFELARNCRIALSRKKQYNTKYTSIRRSMAEVTIKDLAPIPHWNSGLGK